MSGKASQTEEEFQQTVIDFAHLNGWRVAHFRKAMRKDGSYVTPVQADGKGFPDLLMVHIGRIVVAEIKRLGKKPTPEQRQWLEAFQDTNKGEAYWWQADDEEDWVEIERVLTVKYPLRENGDAFDYRETQRTTTSYSILTTE